MGFPIVEAKTLEKIAVGSYENKLTAVNEAVEEDSDTFGGNALLLATFKDHVVVVNEDGQFFKSSYKIDDGGIVKFMTTESMDVPVVNPDNLAEEAAKKAVDNFFTSGSLGENLLGIMSVVSTKRTPLSETQERLDKLFEGGTLWRKHINKNRDKAVIHGWDYDLGVPMDIHPRFENVCEGLVSEDDLKDFEEETTSALMDLENNLVDIYENALVSYQNYKGIVAGMKIDSDNEESLVLSGFEAFAEDYLDHMKEITKFVSEETKKEGCVTCMAFVHDEIARRSRELELAGRLIRKVSAQFVNP